MNMDVGSIVDSRLLGSFRFAKEMSKVESGLFSNNETNKMSESKNRKGVNNDGNLISLTGGRFVWML